MRRILSAALAAALACQAGPPPPSIAETEAELLAADRAFARATAERGADGWAEFLAESGIMLPRRGIVEGRERIKEAMRPSLAPGRPLLDWEPSHAVAAASGDLGYTVGRWRVVDRQAGGDSIRATGNYVSIWRRQSDGTWKVAVDSGNDDPEPRAGQGG